jgi:hypothetical protein
MELETSGYCIEELHNHSTSCHLLHLEPECSNSNLIKQLCFLVSQIHIGFRRHSSFEPIPPHNFSVSVFLVTTGVAVAFGACWDVHDSVTLRKTPVIRRRHKNANLLNCDAMQRSESKQKISSYTVCNWTVFTVTWALLFCLNVSSQWQ